ncbi:MAG: BatA domain-containing protein, partial [Verrucomicrobiales bacterium]|nr:BatA domain-containing protein [Verrucomicrobiales bacterium]
MNWLFPLYLAGGLAVLAPILLHLRKQPPKRKVVFPGVMFLQETAMRSTTRRRVEQWLLLLLRCLLLVLLALIFARPWWRGAETRGAAGAGVARMVLVDV